jgi:hypothetical protein
VTFESGSRLSSIGFGVFDGCSSLTSASIPRSVMAIVRGSLNHCATLSNVTFESSTFPTSVGWNAFLNYPILPRAFLTSLPDISVS